MDWLQLARPYIYDMNIFPRKSWYRPFFICVMGMASHGHALGQYLYHSLTASDGLSQGYVNDILQDRDGFMWFATKDGLSRYDGYQFKVYTHDSYDPSSISSNTINYLYEDSKGRIWICTDDNGLSIYNKLKDSFKRIAHDPKNTNSLSGNKIAVPILELPDGRFLVYSTERALNIIAMTDNFFESDVPPQIRKIDLSGSEYVQYMYKDKKNKVWVIKNSDLYEFLPDQMRLELRRAQVNFNQVSQGIEGDLYANGNPYSVWDGIYNSPLFTSDIAQNQGTTFLRDGNERLWVGITNLALLQV
ncbi:MAG: two-component regulator propeller domain-containing protein, partial [Leadbetterella sp.]|nr:two-component regulator propeller domain-containing protein [Leadbetterella sp.]